MVTEIYLGNPPADIVNWIKNHSQPAAHEETKFTLEGGTVETYNITGTLDQNWLDAHGFWSWGGMYWAKNIMSIEIGSTVTSIGQDVFVDCRSLTSVTFEGKDRATVQGMPNYPFGLNNANENGVTIHCTDEDIQVPYGG